MKISDLINENFDKFQLYYKFLITENGKYNLTAITIENEVFIKHFEDSLVLENALNKDLNGLSLLDVGSGAGFPSIPLKICYPNLDVTIIEPTSKSVNFMNEVIKLLGLKKIIVICGRAEDLAREDEENYDIVCARAVANLPVLLELLSRFCKVSGYVCAYKGDKGYAELKESKNALNELKLEINKVYEYELSENLGTREVIVLQKKNHTPNKYPRRYSEIKKNPL